MAKLGVNVDHVATLRQARRVAYPDPVVAARMAFAEGVSCITAHLREDRRHVRDDDIRAIRAIPKCRFNLEMAPYDEIVKIALEVKPDQVTLVPERREELTTEGGVDVAAKQDFYVGLAKTFSKAGIHVSFFIDPVMKQIEASAATCAQAVEINTGKYSEAKSEKESVKTFRQIENAVAAARGLGLVVHAGHGLNYKNVSPIAAIEGLEELNIGHSIVSQAVYVGFPSAVSTMMKLIAQAAPKPARAET